MSEATLEIQKNIFSKNFWFSHIFGFLVICPFITPADYENYLGFLFFPRQLILAVDKWHFMSRLFEELYCLIWWELNRFWSLLYYKLIRKWNKSNHSYSVCDGPNCWYYVGVCDLIADLQIVLAEQLKLECYEMCWICCWLNDCDI